jgi:hypothetical protein
MASHINNINILQNLNCNKYEKIKKLKGNKLLHFNIKSIVNKTMN